MDVFTNYYRLHKNPGVKKQNLLKYLLSFIDVLAILLAFQTSYFINYYERGGIFYTERNILILFIGILPFWLLILYLVRTTGIPTKRFRVLSLLYLQSSTAVFLLLFFGRILIYKVLKRFGKNGHNQVIVIIFADDSSLPFIENLLSSEKLGYKAVVIFTESVLIKTKYENFSIILPEKFSEIINDLIEVDFVDEVLYIKEESDSAKVREILTTCEELGVTFRLKSNLPKASLSSAVKTDIADGKFLSFINIPNNSYSLAIKKTTDINIALMMIVVLSPLLIILSVLIKLTSKGPIIIKLSKIGWRGRQIKVYRFRTMFSNADRNRFYQENKMKSSGSEFEEDPRITKIGRFLLKSGMDQLPELFNVLKGEMSIIGPRHPLQSDNVKSFFRKYS